MTTSPEMVHVLGERLVREELQRQGYRISGSTVSGIAFYVGSGLRRIPIRVKTIRSGAWQFTTTDVMEIETTPDGVQTVHDIKRPPDPNLVCVLVKLDEDAYFVLTLEDLYRAVRADYVGWLTKHHGRRPRNPFSTHCAVYGKDLTLWEDNWDLIRRRLTA